MPRLPIEDNSRRSLRIRPEQKPAAQAVIEEAEKVRLSERDSLRILELLETPPAPNEKLLAAAKALCSVIRARPHSASTA